MAEVAARTDDEQQVDWLDMMLGNLGQQSGSTSGVVDLPVQQRTFQSVPGKTAFFARLEIHPQPEMKIPLIALQDFIGDAPLISSGHWPALPSRSA